MRNFFWDNLQFNLPTIANWRLVTTFFCFHSMVLLIFFVAKTAFHQVSSRRREKPKATDTTFVCSKPSLRLSPGDVFLMGLFFIQGVFTAPPRFKQQNEKLVQQTINSSRLKIFWLATTYFSFWYSVEEEFENPPCMKPFLKLSL